MITARRILFAILRVAVAAFVAERSGQWQTGRGDLAPLALAPGGPAVGSSGRVWIDTDAACGAATRTDPDDNLAILWLVTRIVAVMGHRHGHLFHPTEGRGTGFGHGPIFRDLNLSVDPDAARATLITGANLDALAL